MEDQALLKDILVGFEYSYMHDDWVNPLEEALEGVTVEQALWRPTEGMGIWDIVLHLAVWNENIVERVETGQAARPKEGAWPPLPQTPNAQEWEAAKQRLRDSLESVRKLLQTTTIEKIQASPYGLSDLLCRLTHNGYHLGQITKIRECAFPAPT